MKSVVDSSQSRKSGTRDHAIMILPIIGLGLAVAQNFLC